MSRCTVRLYMQQSNTTVCGHCASRESKRAEAHGIRALECLEGLLSGIKTLLHAVFDAISAHAVLQSSRRPQH